MNILEEFWYGNIEPAEYDTSSNKEYKELLQLISRNEEKLLATMTENQKELFTKYADCVREYQVTFSIADFMRDLERFYQAMRMHFAFEQMCLGYDEAALELYEDGRHFAGLPFFEQYKYDPDDYPEIDYSSADGDLLKEMELAAEATKERVCGDGFKRTPFDYYEELQEIIVDLIPDFRIRLKINPRTRRMVFAADVHSVFDICWYTLARKLSEDVAPEDKGFQLDEKKTTEGVVMSCPFCGEAFIRKWNRSVTCGKAECNRARQRKNKQNSRKKQKIAAQQSK